MTLFACAPSTGLTQQDVVTAVMSGRKHGAARAALLPEANIKNAQRRAARIGVRIKLQPTTHNQKEAPIDCAARVMVQQAAQKLGIYLTDSNQVLCGTDPEGQDAPQIRNLIAANKRWLQELERHRARQLALKPRTPRKMWVYDRGVWVDPEGQTHAPVASWRRAVSPRGHGSVPVVAHGNSGRELLWGESDVPQDQLRWRQARIVDLIEAMPGEWAQTIAAHLLKDAALRDEQGRLIVGDEFLEGAGRSSTTYHTAGVTLFLEAPKKVGDAGLRLNLRLSAWRQGQHSLKRARASFIARGGGQDPAHWPKRSWMSHTQVHGYAAGGPGIWGAPHRLMHAGCNVDEMSAVLMMLNLCLSSGTGPRLRARILPKDHAYWDTIFAELSRRGLEASLPRGSGPDHDPGLDPLLLTLEVLALRFGCSPEPHSRGAEEALTFAQSYWSDQMGRRAPQRPGLKPELGLINLSDVQRLAKEGSHKKRAQIF